MAVAVAVALPPARTVNAVRLGRTARAVGSPGLLYMCVHRTRHPPQTPFGGAFFAFILLHALVGFVRDSDLGTQVARKLFRVKQDLCVARCGCAAAACMLACRCCCG